MRKLFHIPYGKLNVESAIILRLALEACRGDMKAIEIWLDRRYGKVSLPMEVTVPAGPLVQILNAPQGDQTVKVTPKTITPAQDATPTNKP